MNPEIEPTPMHGDIVAPDGTIIPAGQVRDLLRLFNVRVTGLHQCHSKVKLRDMAGQLLVRNRLLEKELAEAQATIAKLQHPMAHITEVSLPKMTDEEMANFQALLETGGSRPYGLLQRGA